MILIDLDNSIFDFERRGSFDNAVECSAAPRALQQFARNGRARQFAARLLKHDHDGTIPFGRISTRILVGLVFDELQRIIRDRIGVEVALNLLLDLPAARHKLLHIVSRGRDKRLVDYDSLILAGT